jgi:hypothetical protein
MVKPETMSYLKERTPEYWNIWRKKAGPLGNKMLDKAFDSLKEYRKKQFQTN